MTLLYFSWLPVRECHPIADRWQGYMDAIVPIEKGYLPPIPVPVSDQFSRKVIATTAGSLGGIPCW